VAYLQLAGYDVYQVVPRVLLGGIGKRACESIPVLAGEAVLI